MPQSLSNTLVHIVFSTKHRQHIIDEKIESQLFSYIAKICDDQNCKTIIVGGYSNHVHIFCALNRSVTQANLVRKIKSTSSKWMKSKGDKYANFYWQDGYAIFSVGRRHVEDLRRYILNQKNHHQKISFQDEHREVLKSNKIEFDENYVWD